MAKRGKACLYTKTALMMMSQGHLCCNNNVGLGQTSLVYLSTRILHFVWFDLELTRMFCKACYDLKLNMEQIFTLFNLVSLTYSV